MVVYQVMKLGDVLEKIIGGGTPSKRIDRYWNGTIPWATVKDMKDGKFQLYDTEDHITEDGVRNSATNIIPKGTVIISTRMGLGRCFINLRDMAINQDLKALIPNKKIRNGYLLWVYRNKSNLIETMGHGTTVKGIRIEDLKQIEIEVSDHEIQEKIATILWNYDNLIENDIRRIQILEQMAKLIFDEWFVKFKFPGYEHVKMVDSGTDFGEIPEGWEIRDLNNICSKVTDGTHDTPEPTLRGYPLVTGKHITNGFIDFSKCYFISEEDHIGVMKRSKPEKGDIIFSNIGTLGSTILVDEDFEFSIKNVALFKPLRPYYSSFLYLYFSSLQTYQRMINTSSGVAQSFFSLKLLRSLKILMPPENLLIKFDKFVGPILKLRSEVNKKNRILTKTRDFLLPMLISGEIDVSELDIKISKEDT
jgi:type I restriction enzyme S subunit